MKKLALMSAAAVLAFGVSPAFAEHHEGGKHDGHKGKMFEESDANGDGVISKDEFKAHHEKKMDEWFSKLDQDGDGNVTKEEIKAGREKMHERMKDKMKERREKRQEGEAEDSAE